MTGHKDGSHKKKKITRQEFALSSRATKKRRGPLATDAVTTAAKVTQSPVSPTTITQQANTASANPPPSLRQVEPPCSGSHSPIANNGAIADMASGGPIWRPLIESGMDYAKESLASTPKPCSFHQITSCSEVR